MLLLMAQSATNPDRTVWFAWEREDLTATLIEAESLFKSGSCYCVKVVEGRAVVKAKWGPEDPGTN